MDRFIGLRGELWPNESRPTAPITTLEAEARRYLDPGTPESLCLEVIERVMREFVRDGKSAPTSLGFCRLSMETATANHKRAQSSPTLAGVAAADPSFDPEGNRWRFRVQRWLADPKSWLTQWGYEPDDRSTMVPATVLAEFGIRPAQAHAAAAGG